MTDAMKLELLKEYGIVDYSVIKNITGMTIKQYQKAILIKVPSYYNGLLDHTIKFEKKWFKKNKKSIHGVVLKEEYVVDFIKSNKGKYTIQELSKMVILGGYKVPDIIMKNNLYDYVKPKDRKTNQMKYEVAKSRFLTFYQNKNDKHITIVKLSDIIGCSSVSIQRLKKEF